MEIKWHDLDPETGERRYLVAARFAGVWRFRSKSVRRGPWEKEVEPTREMWEHILDGFERRYRRREGVEEPDIRQVQTLLAEVIRKEELRNS